MKNVDCRGMACPAPVVTVKRALEALQGGDSLEVLLDEGAPVENVTRFATNRGYLVAEKRGDAGVMLRISSQVAPSAPGGPLQAASTPGQSPAHDGGLFLVTSDRLGDGPDDLGRLLMKNFIITLLDLQQVPDKMIFLNRGVFLTTAGSEVIDALKELGNRGAEILSCGVCLDYFHRKEALEAGAVTNMFTIAESMQQALTVVRL